MGCLPQDGIPPLHDRCFTTFEGTNSSKTQGALEKKKKTCKGKGNMNEDKIHGTHRNNKKKRNDNTNP